MNVQVLDRLMRNLAEQQQGVVGREQLRERGVCRQAVAARLRSPDWTAVTPRVLRLAGMPANDKQRAMSAVLDSGAGAVLSHRSAAAAWGLPGFNLAELELSRQRTGANRGTTLARLHHPCHLPPHHYTIHRGLPLRTWCGPSSTWPEASTRVGPSGRCTPHCAPGCGGPRSKITFMSWPERAGRESS